MGEDSQDTPLPAVRSINVPLKAQSDRPLQLAARQFVQWRLLLVFMLGGFAFFLLAFAVMTGLGRSEYIYQ